MHIFLMNISVCCRVSVARMGARTMLSIFKSGGGANAPEANPIWHKFEAGKQSATAGPENLWQILEGYRKSDGKVG